MHTGVTDLALGTEDCDRLALALLILEAAIDEQGRDVVDACNLKVCATLIRSVIPEDY